MEPASAGAIAANHLACVEVAILCGVAPLVVAHGADVSVSPAAATAYLGLKREVGMAAGVEGTATDALAQQQRAQGLVRPSVVADEAHRIVRKLQVRLKLTMASEVLEGGPLLESTP